MKSISLILLTLVLSSTYLLADEAPSTENKDILTPVVVIAEKTDAVLTVVTDTKAPRQPVPAQDGADYLKTIPGFNVIRKGGSDGDPVFRGMTGSRLNIMLDGEMLLGGCSMRMDPPTAYVFPESYDTVTVIKGPQTVIYGPGNSAGTVLFERDHVRRDDKGINVNASALVGGFSRQDDMLDISGGNKDFSVRGTVLDNQQANYRDGDGKKVHSEYHRYSANGTFAWTPNDNTLLELSMANSNGEAAYADRSMDGALFERENAGLRFRQLQLSDVVSSVEAQIYYNYVDHVMDNYSLRLQSGSLMAMNPDRRTAGGRIAVTLETTQNMQWVVGIDAQQNTHRIRTTMNQTAMPFEDMDRTPDAELKQMGIFAEMTEHLTENNRLLAGVRYDQWQAKDQRDIVNVSMMMSMPNPSKNATRHNDLGSGFIRYEHDINKHTLYAGLGRSERFPDYWEMIAKETLSSISAFDIKTEKTKQWDIGYLYNEGKWHASVSAFYNTINDFLLIQTGVAKGMRTATVVRNVDAHTYGAEAELAWNFAPYWQTDITLTRVRGINDTDNSWLGQMPPLEARLALNYNNNTWSYGAMWRVVAEQDEVAINQGNIVGQDIANNAGFAVFSLNGGWKATKQLQLTAGIDNLFNKTYAEHLSRGGAMVSGFDQTTRVNELGRMAWIKANISF